MEYLMHIGVMLSIYIILVLSTNLTVGLANMLSLCQAAFYGIGAYIGAILMQQYNFSLITIALIAMSVTGLVSLIVSFASVRLKGDYFILATLGLQMIIYTLMINWTSVTNGPYGISGIPITNLAGSYEMSNVYIWFIVTMLVSFFVALFFSSLQQSQYGRLLKAISTNELSAQALGYDTASAKVWAFFISSAFAGLAGVLYASYIRYIDPSCFTLNESIFIITALFIGGAGKKIWGPVAGAAAVIVLPEILRFIGFSNTIAANLKQIIYGLVLIIIVFTRPQGLFGDTEIK